MIILNFIKNVLFVIPDGDININLSICLGLLYSSSYTNPNSRVYFQKMGYTSGSLTNILRIYNAGYYKSNAGLNYAKSIINCINK